MTLVLGSSAAWAPTLAVLALALAGCEEERPRIRHADRMSIWAEDLPAERVTAGVAFCGEHRLNLNVSLIRGVADRAYVEKLCAEAEQADVALRFWPGLPFDEGYWPNQGNVDAFLAWVDELVALGAEVCPRLDGVVVDMEMPWERNLELQERWANAANPLEVVTWLLSGRDRAAFDLARTRYAEAGRAVRAQGLTWTVTTLPLVADDYLDGDETLALALWTPIEGIEWEQVSFQAYRSLFDAQFKVAADRPAYTSGLVSSYARSAIDHWGELAALDLGITGGGVGPTLALANAAEMQADIGAALAEGIPPGRIAVFSLDGLDGVADAPAWIQVPAPQPATPAPVDEEIRQLFQALDAIAAD